MSDHVLCMVLYLVELGLDNHAQEEKEDEVIGSSAKTLSFSFSLCQVIGEKQSCDTALCHSLAWLDSFLNNL